MPAGNRKVKVGLRTLFWRDLDTAEDLSASDRSQVRRVRLWERCDISVTQRERCLKAIKHEDDVRWRHALVARRRELVGAADRAVVLVALEVNLLLRRPAFFDERFA